MTKTQVCIVLDKEIYDAFRSDLKYGKSASQAIRELIEQAIEEKKLQAQK